MRAPVCRRPGPRQPVPPAAGADQRVGPVRHLPQVSARQAVPPLLPLMLHLQRNASWGGPSGPSSESLLTVGAVAESLLTVGAVRRRLLQRTDWFTQEKACKLLTLILLARPHKELQLANGSGPSTSAAAAARSSPAAPIVSAASEGVQVRVGGLGPCRGGSKG